MCAYIPLSLREMRISAHSAEPVRFLHQNLGKSPSQNYVRISLRKSSRTCTDGNFGSAKSRKESATPGQPTARSSGGSPPRASSLTRP
eukprot:6190754-Pleurochrysis_carterae.AAC.4